MLVPPARTARPVNLELAVRARAAAAENSRREIGRAVKRAPRERLERVDCVRRPVVLGRTRKPTILAVPNVRLVNIKTKTGRTIARTASRGQLVVLSKPHLALLAALAKLRMRVEQVALHVLPGKRVLVMAFAVVVVSAHMLLPVLRHAPNVAVDNMTMMAIQAPPVNPAALVRIKTKQPRPSASSASVAQK